MTNPVQILDVHGQPLRRSRVSMLSGSSNSPYDAADISGSHMAAWRPYLGSPDIERNMYRDRIVSRVRDVVRNDGWASGAVTRILDNAVGANFRPVFKPDYRALASYTGIKGFDPDWADAFGRALEAHWRSWALDMGRYCDAQRNLTVPQLMRLGFRHKLIDGDAVAQMLWLPERVGYGKAHYATTIQLIDPDRLSNPQLRFDQRHMRGGVEIDDLGAAVAYWIRRAHQGDYFAAADSVHWDRIERETSWGRPNIVHDFDHDRASEHRGGTGIFTPVLQRLRMLVKYDGAELDSALINAIFAAYIESPFDHDMIQEALGDEELSHYQNQRTEFHNERRMSIGEVRIPTLFPGEKINAVTATRPNVNFPSFEKAVLRNVAAATGMSAQQLSQDWSDVNYSSARAAMLEAWKTLTRRRDDFAIGFGQPINSCFVEESMEVDDLPLPPGAPDFSEFRAAYCRAHWMGPGRGWVDPVKEKQGSVLGMDACLTTLEMECAEQGLDVEEVMIQRKRELKMFKDMGIPPPTWAGMNAGEVIKEPEAI